MLFGRSASLPFPATHASILKWVARSGGEANRAANNYSNGMRHARIGHLSCSAR